MKLSICMMVKNEEKNLERCLGSLKNLVKNIESEIIVVDTGSSDKTVEIAKRYTNRVYFHKWNDDFSAMRNISISYAKGDWIFIIDADEEIIDDSGIIQYLKNFNNSKYNSLAITVKNLMTEDKNDINVADLTSLRFFRNDGTFKYTGIVHNEPQFKEPVLLINAVIAHYGYINTDKEMKEKKFIRTSTLLKKALSEDPSNIYYLYQLSIVYSFNDDFERSYNYIKDTYNAVIENNGDFNKYKYIYLHYARSCICLKKYLECIKICKEGLNLEQELVDLYYYLGISYQKIDQYDSAIDSFTQYFKYKNNFENLEISRDVSLTFYTLKFDEDVYCNLFIIYFNKKDYITAEKYYRKLTSDTYIKIANLFWPDILYKFGKFDELYKLILNSDDKLGIQTIIERNLEIEKDVDKKIRLFNSMSQIESTYGTLNKIRYDFYIGCDLNLDINEFLKNLKYNFNKLQIYYGDIIYYMIYSKINLNKLFANMTESTIDVFMKFVSKKYSDISKKIINYILNFKSEKSIDTVKVNKILYKYVLILEARDSDDRRYFDIFKDYISSGIDYLKLVYNMNNIVDNSMFNEFKTHEELFFAYLYLAQLNDNKYVEYLEKSLKIYPYMNRGIRLLLDNYKAKKEKATNELESYKNKVKSVIKSLIESNKLDEAKSIIDEYEQIVSNDAEIYLIKGCICIEKGKLIEAEEVLKQGININNNNFKLFYNLGYLYNIQNRKVEALAAYTIAKLVCNENYNRKLIEKEILSLCGKKANSYNVILCGKVEQCVNFEEVLKEWNIIGYITNEKNSKNDKKVIQIDNIKNYNYDFIMILDENDENKIFQELKNKEIKNNIYFYSNFKISVIEGFDYRIRKLLCKNDIEMIITGSSYAEVGIKAEKLNKNAVNFAFSSQDLYYDYEVANYLLRYNNVKNSVRYAIIGVSYYCFDYDMSQSIAKYRIHRYKGYMQDFHNNNDENGINIAKVFYEKSSGMKEYYELNKWKEKTIVKYKNEEQDYIAKKNSTMDYDLTRKENIDIFYKYLSLLKSKDIKPIIVICPTSKYYYQYFNDCHQKNKFYKILNSFKKDFDFQVIDYFNSNLFEDNDFWDYGHLNGKGAEKFTEILNSEIKGL